MAIKLPSVSATIKVILRQDDALDPDKVTDAEYEKYLETLDESVLTFKEGQQPTRFVLRKVLRYDAAMHVQNTQMSLKGQKLDFNVGYMIEEVRQSLTDIENPADVSPEEAILYKRDSDGGASKELVEGLHAIGAVMNLFTARQNSNQHVTGENLKKKSAP